MGSKIYSCVLMLLFFVNAQAQIPDREKSKEKGESEQRNYRSQESCRPTKTTILWQEINSFTITIWPESGMRKSPDVC